MKFQHLGKRWTIFQRKTAPDTWYFAPRWGARKQKVWHCFRDKTTRIPLTRDAALAAAKQLIEAHFRGPDQYTALRDATKLRDTLTVGAILEQWDTAGCPLPNGIPRTEPEQKRQRAALAVLKRWWTPHHVHTAATLHGQYARWRRAQVKPGASNHTGNRSIELELTTLSNAFRWAVTEQLAKTNPFAQRERYVTTKAINHCTTYMPTSAAELHRLAGWLLRHESQNHVIAGAQLLFMALTGLRAGEPGHLRWDARDTGTDPKPGCIFPRQLDGRAGHLLAIVRLKSGINPAIEMRPDLEAFLAHWKPYCRSHWPESPWWFPDPGDQAQPFCRPEDKRKRLSAPLDRACVALELPERHPHGMRAYYVRVRRSQGASDVAIADELGESTGASIIASTYGRADQIRGDGRFTFVPTDPNTKPAWELLTQPATNIIAL